MRVSLLGAPAIVLSSTHPSKCYTAVFRTILTKPGYEITAASAEVYK